MSCVLQGRGFRSARFYWKPLLCGALAAASALRASPFWPVSPLDAYPWRSLQLEGWSSYLVEQCDAHEYPLFSRYRKSRQMEFVKLSY